MCEVLDRIENRGIQRGIKQRMQQGMQRGENAAIELMQILYTQGRIDDMKRVAADREYRHELMKELAILG